MKAIQKLFIAAASAALLMIPYVADAESGSEYIHEGFESEVSSTVWTGAYTVDGGVNKYLSSDTETGKEIFCYIPEELTEGAVISSYDIMIPKTPTSAIRIKQVWDASLSKRPYYIMASTTGNLIYNNNTVLGTYQTGEWFNVTEVVDLSAKKVYVYINGKPCGAADGLSFNDEEASGIKRIQTQFDTNKVAIDNAYVSLFDDKDSADNALADMLSGKVYLQKSGFSVDGSKSVQNAVTPVTEGAVVVSYKITTTGKARLMQIYDAQESPKRSVLIQLNSSGGISVNGNGTGVTWTHNTPNVLTLIYDVAERTSTVYYNGMLAGREGYAVHSDNGLCLADIRTQDEDGGGLTVSDAWAKSFSSYEDAVRYVKAVNNIDNEATVAYYGADVDELKAVFNDYSRAMDALACTGDERSAILSKLGNMLPYTSIFSDNFNSGEAVTGYTVSTGTEVTDDGALKLTNTDARARLLKTVANDHSSFFVSFDFMQTERSNIDSIARITDNGGNKEAVKIFAENGDIALLYGPATEIDSVTSFKKAVLIDNYAANKWYSIEMYADMDTQKTAVYIDGQYKGSYEFMYSDIENMRRVFDTYTNSAGTYYIDNISIYKDSLKAAAAAVSVPSKLVQDIELPDFIGDYSCEWSSDNGAIGSDGSVTQPDNGALGTILTLTVSNGAVGISVDHKIKVAADDLLYEIGDVIYADENGFSTSQQNDAKQIKRIYLDRYQAVNGKLIAAQYGADGELIDVLIQNAVDGVYDINMDIADGADKITLFVWDGAQLSTPFAQAKKIY